MAHGLESVIEAARTSPEIHFVFVGEGARKEALQREGEGLANVTFLDGQPRERMPDIYRMADVGLVPLRDLPVFRTVRPSKIFEIYAARRPIVLGVAGEAAELVEESGGGLVVPPEDASALAEALTRLKDDPQLYKERVDSGRRFVEDHYDRERLAERYLEILDDAIEHHAR